MIPQLNIKGKKMWDRLEKSVGIVIEERLSSPLISTFVISWALWNFKFFVVLFSDTSIVETFRLIHSICFPTPFMSVFNGLVAPLTITIAYIYYLPIPSMRVYTKWKTTQKELNKIKQSIEDQQLLSQEDSRALRAKERDLREQLDLAGTEASRLREDLRATERRAREAETGLKSLQIEHEAITQTNGIKKSPGNALATLPPPTESPNIPTPSSAAREEYASIDEDSEASTKLNQPNLVSGQVQLLQLVGHSLEALTKEDIVLRAQGSRIQNKYNLEELFGKDFLTETQDQNENWHVELTQEARRYLILNGLAEVKVALKKPDGGLINSLPVASLTPPKVGLINSRIENPD